jgi:hypothetical protein
MGPWNPTFRKGRETWGTLFRGARQRRGPSRRPVRLDCGVVLNAEQRPKSERSVAWVSCIMGFRILLRSGEGRTARPNPRVSEQSVRAVAHSLEFSLTFFESEASVAFRECVQEPCELSFRNFKFGGR